MDVDIEQQGPQNDGTTGSEKKTTIKMAIGQVNQCLMKVILKTRWWFYAVYHFHRDVAFLVVCVVAIAVDPLFFYLPVIYEATKCIALDTTLEIIAICVRSLLDLVAFGNLVANRNYMMRSDYVINILAILPFPQVLVPIISKMNGSKLRIIRKFLNALVILQYVPRVFRIYRLWTIAVNEITTILPKSTTVYLNGRYKNINTRKGLFMVMKAGLNLYLYLVASHALGAFWYFFSIERETTCWQLACENDNGCSKSTSFNCGDDFRNYTFLNDYCPLETPNTTLFDFGIFQEARKSGILASMDFPRKTMYCFWWGLRNLSSLGQNLETSSYYWENCFTVLISIFGLLLFLYFIGNLQVYMQWEASTELDEIYKSAKKAKRDNAIFKWAKKAKRDNAIKWAKKAMLHKSLQKSNYKQLETDYKRYYLKYIDEESTKLRSIEYWISTIGLPEDLKNRVISYVKPILQSDDQNKDIIDTENPFPHLPTPLRTMIKLHLCPPLLRKVPIFGNKSNDLLNLITCKFLKQVHYNQNSYIVREGEPLDAMIFVVKGMVWMYTSNHGNKADCLKDGDLFGSDLVEWMLESPGLSNLPLSKMTLKCHTKVEAFYIMAGDLKELTSHRWWKFSEFKDIPESDSKQLKHFAASSIQAMWRHPKKHVLE